MRQKRRKLDTDGQYKTVVQILTESRKKEETSEDEEDIVQCKRMKISVEEVEEDGEVKDDTSGEEEGPEIREKQVTKTQYIVLGQRIKDAILEEPIFWHKRRREILERMREEEDARNRRIEKATRIQRGWELTVECKRLLLEFDNEWKNEEKRKEKRQKDLERQDQIGRAAGKKRTFEEKQKKSKIDQKITDMLKSIPRNEAEKIEAEVRRKENEEFREKKKALWRKWRGKTRIVERKDQVPKEIDKIEGRLKEIEERIKDYKERKEVQLKKRNMKKEEWKRRNRMIGLDTWSMMTWLTQYIEENKYEWGRRRERKKEPRNDEYELWNGMDEQEMIEMMKAHEEKERINNESKRDKAKRRQKYWKEWRKGRVEESCIHEEVKLIEDEHQEVLDTSNEERMEEMSQRTAEMLKRRKEWRKEKREEVSKVKTDISKHPPLVQGGKELGLTEKPQLDLQCEARPNTDIEIEKGVDNVPEIGGKEPDLTEDPQLDLQDEERLNKEGRRKRKKWKKQVVRWRKE